MFTLSPYRRRFSPTGSVLGNDDIAPVFVAVWLAAVIRLVMGVIHHETFGTELTLVAVAIALLPLMLFTSARQR